MALTAAEEAQTRSLIAQEAAILALADEEPAIISNLGATDVSLSDLTAATSINDADLMLVRQGTTDKSSAFSVIKSWFNIATTSNDPSFVDDSVRPASTGWVRGAMLSIATSAGFAISLSANGYIKLPSWLGGIIIQWGTSGGIAVDSSASIVLPVSFTASFYSVVVTSNSTGLIASGKQITATNRSSLSAFQLFNGSDRAGNYDYLAIGK